MIDLSTFDPGKFAKMWADAWNRRDAEAVLAWYADACVFVSPLALEVTGAGEVRGKEALRAYWTAALARRKTIHFTVDAAPYDAASHTISVIYRSDGDHGARRVCEVMTFGKDGFIVRGEAFHGAPV